MYLCFIIISGFFQDDSSLTTSLMFLFVLLLQLLVAHSPDSLRHHCCGDLPAPACTKESQEVPFLKPSSSPLIFTFSSFAPSHPCSALLPSKQIGWGDRYRRSTFLCPSHTYCSPCPFFVLCLNCSHRSDCTLYNQFWTGWVIPNCWATRNKNSRGR